MGTSNQALFCEVAESTRATVAESGLNGSEQLLVFTSNIGAFLCEYTDGDFQEDIATHVAELTINAYILACKHFNASKTIN
jgi:hypothetical protein